MVVSFLYRADAGSGEYWMVIGFESRAAYLANAARADQHLRCTRLRELLVTEPEWHDGEIVQTAGLVGI